MTCRGSQSVTPHSDTGLVFNQGTAVHKLPRENRQSFLGENSAYDDHGYRGDRPPRNSNTYLADSSKQPLRGFVSNHELSTVTASSGYHTGSTSSNYTKDSYRSNIVTPTISSGFGKGVLQTTAKLQRADLLGCDSVPDNVPKGATDYKIPVLAPNPNAVDKQRELMLPTVSPSSRNIGYTKPEYPVLIGNTVKVCGTHLYASMPHHNKYMVKEKIRDSTGASKVKLTLKSSDASHAVVVATLPDVVEKDGFYDGGYGEKVHYRENCKNPGHVIYSCDKSFQGDIKYPLPNGKAATSKIGKGGNGFVFTIYHAKKEYAVKKTIYRANEVNVHSALKHKNILPLVAVLIGEKHERHSGRFYCFHFLPRMDFDLRSVLASKEVGCLKNFYSHCSGDTAKWDLAFSNVKYVLKETLKALGYLHSIGYVHRDVKASNIMLKMPCRCKVLSCDCKSRFSVKLGDFDSAGTVPGLGIVEPTDQFIKFASILPLGTPGYRAPEVSMHITLSGPYEPLYTTAVDMWSFGCLCLNICIGKTAALKQREEASLLLSMNSTSFAELWERTTKIKELENALPFKDDLRLVELVRRLLQVDYKKRLTADAAQSLL